MDSVETNVELTEETSIEAQLAAARVSGVRSGIEGALTAGVIFPAVFAAIAWPVTPGVWTLWMLGATATLLLYRTSVRAWGRRTFRNIPELRRRFALHVSEEGIRERGEFSDILMSWAVVRGYGESAHAVVLIGPHASVLTHWPKSSFEADQLGELRRLLRAHGPKRVSSVSPNHHLRTLAAFVVLTLLFAVAYTLWGT